MALRAAATMAKSIRSKRARKFRALKREKNEVVERKRLYAVTAKLGTLPKDAVLEDEPPLPFAHKAPIVRETSGEARGARRTRGGGGCGEGRSPVYACACLSLPRSLSLSLCLCAERMRRCTTLLLRYVTRHRFVALPCALSRYATL